MKYYLVDNYDNINTTVDLSDDIGLSGARTYFLGVKRIEEKEFDKLWKVMTKEQWDLQFKANLQNRQNGTLKYEWWKEEATKPDEGFDYQDESWHRKKKGFTNRQLGRFLKL